MRKLSWSEFQLRRLRKMYLADYTIRDIAESLGMSRTTVHEKVRELGLRRIAPMEQSAPAATGT